MQKNRFPGTHVVIILLALAIGPARSVSAGAVPESTASLPNPAASPWKTGWVDSSTSSHVGSYPSVAYSPVDDLPYVTYYDAVNGN